jgi:hypothetical protein
MNTRYVKSGHFGSSCSDKNLYLPRLVPIIVACISREEGANLSISRMKWLISVETK